MTATPSTPKLSLSEALSICSEAKIIVDVHWPHDILHSNKGWYLITGAAFCDISNRSLFERIGGGAESLKRLRWSIAYGFPHTENVVLTDSETGEFSAVISSQPVYSGEDSNVLSHACLCVRRVVTPDFCERLSRADEVNFSLLSPLLCLGPCGSPSVLDVDSNAYAHAQADLGADDAVVQEAVGVEYIEQVVEQDYLSAAGGSDFARPWSPPRCS